MTRLSLSLSALLLAGLLVAACDSTPSPPTPPPGAWTLGTCVDADGPEALFVGLDAIACFSQDGLAEAVLDTAGFTAGESYVFFRADEMLVVLDQPDLQTPAYSLRLRDGRVTRLSEPGVSDSQIARAGHGDADRFLVADYLKNTVPSDDARFVFTWLDGGKRRPGLRLTLPDIGFVGFRDTDYDPVTNRSVHLLHAETDVSYGQYLLLVDHTTGSYTMERMSDDSFTTFVRFTPEGTLLVLDIADDTVYAVTDTWTPVLDLSGQPDDVTFVRLVENRAGDVFTFTAAAGDTRVLRFLPGGSTEEVLHLPEPQRGMAISLSSDAFCFRSFHPFGYSAPTYPDTIRVVSAGGEPVAAWPVVLRTDTYESARLSCR